MKEVDELLKLQEDLYYAQGKTLFKEQCDALTMIRDALILGNNARQIVSDIESVISQHFEGVI